MPITLVPFLVIVTLLVFFLGIIWERSSLFNTSLKVLLLSLATWGSFLLLQVFGFIVKA